MGEFQDGGSELAEITGREVGVRAPLCAPRGPACLQVRLQAHLGYPRFLVRVRNEHGAVSRESHAVDLFTVFAF
jgi:hypothetical protein